VAARPQGFLLSLRQDFCSNSRRTGLADADATLRHAKSGGKAGASSIPRRQYEYWLAPTKRGLADASVAIARLAHIRSPPLPCYDYPSWRNPGPGGPEP
jgi:hypothetical protein